MNEERKLLISYNQFPPSEVNRLKKVQNTIINPSRKRGNLNQKNNEEKSSNREKISFLSEFLKTKIPIPQLVLSQRSLCSQMKRNPLYPCVESHFIFSFLWSSCCFVNESARNSLMDFLLELLKTYIEENSLEKNIFANGLLELIENKKYGFMEYFYDMGSCRWILWKETRLPDYHLISNNYHADLDYAEMVRLNPLIADVQVLKKYMGEKQLQMNAFPNVEEQQYVVNDISKKCRYFLDYFLGYDKFFFITSSSQSGKTTVIKNKIKKMLEQNICKVISLSLTGNTKAETVNN